MRLGIPIEPDAETARRWLEQELSKPEYEDRPEGWFQRFQQWLNDVFERLVSISEGGSGLGVPGGLVVALLVTAAAVVVLLLVLGPLRRSRAKAKSAAVFDDDDREAVDIRAAAIAAAARGEWTVAVVERFRALVRAVEERGLIAVVPGMTAAEFSASVGARLSEQRRDLERCADIFDAVRYGHDEASEELYDFVARTDDAVTLAKAAIAS